MSEIRYCYQIGLQIPPAPVGRVVVRFVIGASGKVPASEILRSTMDAPRIEQCLASAVRRWLFPVTRTREVVVTYPFGIRLAGGD